MVGPVRLEQLSRLRPFGMKGATLAPGGAAVAAVAAFVLASAVTCSAKHSKRPGLLTASHLVLEISKIQGCDVPGNSVVYYNVENGMISKVDFAISGFLNVTRRAAQIASMSLTITKCRELVSPNTCELFQTWRFDKDPCKATLDPNAVWSSTLQHFSPRVTCPLKQTTYRMRNVTIGTGVLSTVPLPWEGNVWLIRLSMMETKSLHHVCTDLEVHVHRVRD